MENETSGIEKRQIPSDSGEMIIEAPKSCEEHTFKKARYPWQIKGQVTAANNVTGGETSQVKTECDSKFCKNNNQIKNTVDTRLETQNTTLVEGSNDTKCKLDLVLSSNKEEDLCNDVKVNMGESVNAENVHASVSNLQSTCTKRKCNSDKCGTDNIDTKRAKTLQDLRVEGQLGGGVTRSERFSSLQTRHGTATSNPDFSRAISSILPNIQGLDIPSFIWQKQEMGCAIVDNVFNRTLEEMGLSPDPVVNLNASTRLTLENHGIESAIRNRGLRPSGSQIEGHVLANMVDLQQNATREDFEHTQNQLSVMLRRAQSHPCVNDSHVEIKVENSQDSDSSNCEKNVNESPAAHQSTSLNLLDLSKVISPTSSDKRPGNKIEPENTVYDSCDEDEILSATNDSYECITMEDSDGSHDRGVVHIVDLKHSENVLDLAVSTAILNQGLTYESA